MLTTKAQEAFYGTLWIEVQENKTEMHHKYGRMKISWDRLDLNTEHAHVGKYYEEMKGNWDQNNYSIKGLAHWQKITLKLFC